MSVSARIAGFLDPIQELVLFCPMLLSLDPPSCDTPEFTFNYAGKSLCKPRRWCWFLAHWPSRSSIGNPRVPTRCSSSMSLYLTKYLSPLFRRSPYASNRASQCSMSVCAAICRPSAVLVLSCGRCIAAQPNASPVRGLRHEPACLA